MSPPLGERAISSQTTERVFEPLLADQTLEPAYFHLTPLPLLTTHPTAPNSLTGSFSKAARLIVVSLALGQGACDTTVAPPVVTSIAPHSSTALAAVAGAAVTEPPSVIVKEQGGAAMAGVPVSFTVISGGGTTTGSLVTTNASGVATIGGWTLGTVAGSNSLTAATSGLTPVTFIATGTAGAPAFALKTAGDAQSAMAGSAVSAAPRVTVKDANGNPVSGVTVVFAVASGGGSVTGGTQTTSTAGVADVGGWTLGTTAGANTLAAAAGSLPVLTFAATVLAGPAASLTKIAGDSQAALASSVVSIAPSVTVKDAHGNFVSGAVVTFTVASGGGSVTGATPTSNSSGDATAGSWTLGSTLGANTLTASATGVAAVTFTATVIPPLPIVGTFPDESFTNLPPSMRDPFDGTKVNLVRTIRLPGNCPQSFAIGNVGPQGSTLLYQVNDDGGLGGFLDFTNGSGSLTAGSSQTISVTVDPRFVSGEPTLVGATLGLSINTPQASNFQRSFVSFDIRSNDDQLIGTWSGTWSGVGYGANSLTTPVTGNWVLQISSVDFLTGNIEGTLSWTGTDAVWLTNGTIPSPIAVNRTTTFTAENSSIQLNSTVCGQENVTIQFNRNFTNPPSNYGPNGFLYLNLSGSVRSGSHFHANPLWPSGHTGLSSGVLVGSKDPP